MKSENRLKVKNGELFYRTTGMGKEAIILIHGIPTNSFLWIELMNLLGSDYQVIAPDLLGYGQSSRNAKPENLSLPKQAEYIIELLDELKIKKAHFIGHDLGGGITQIIGTSYKERVLSCIIADGVAFSNWPLPMVVALRKPSAPEFEPSVYFIEKMIRGGLYHQELAVPQLIEAFINPFNHAKGPKELQLASLALDHTQTQDLVPLLSKSKFKTTILWGEHDPYLPSYWAYRLNDVLPNSKVVLIPEASHYSMIDNPLFFIQEVKKHLKEYN